MKKKCAVIAKRCLDARGSGWNPDVWPRSIASIAESLCRTKVPTVPQEAAAREAAEARELVEEVRAVVAENYLDARGSGWDPAAWDAACQRVLAGPLRDTAAAHRCAETLSTPSHSLNRDAACQRVLAGPLRDTAAAHRCAETL